MLIGLIVMALFRFVGSKINAFISIFAFRLQPVNTSYTITRRTSWLNYKLMCTHFCKADFYLKC